MIILAAAMALLADATVADPITPARSGQVQCYVPDRARKTCRSIGAYAQRPDGTFDNRAIVLIAESPPITMETVAPVAVRADQICGTMHASDLDAARFAVGGNPLTADDAAPLRDAMTEALQALFEREICVAYVVDGDGQIGRVTVDGVRKPEMDQPVIWVPTSVGYRVAP